MDDNCGEWVESVGVASGLFFCSSIPTSLFIFKMFWFLFMLFLCNIPNVAQRTFEIVQKLKSRKNGDIIISTRMHVDCTRASRDFHVRGTE